MRRLGLMALTLGFVSGCILNPGDNTAPVQKHPMIGVAILEERTFQGAVTSEFDMGFWKKSDTSQGARQGARRFQTRTAADFRTGPICSTETVSIKTRGAVPLFSAGKVQFYPITESTPLEVLEDTSHFYQRKIDGAINDGDYWVIGEGAEMVGGFKERLRVPRKIDEAKMNGSSFQDKMGAIKKGESALLEWRRPSFGTKDSILIVDIYGLIDEHTLQKVECLDLEVNYDTNETYLKWLLPKVYVQQLPNTIDAVVDFSRELAYSSNSRNPKMELRGLRTSRLQIVIGE